MDISKEEIEKEFKKQIEDLGIRIDDMVLLNEISKFEEYIKQRKKSKYSLKDQVQYWIQNDKGMLQQSIKYKIKLEKQRIYEEKRIAAQKENKILLEKTRESNKRFSTILFTLEDKYKKKYEIKEIPLMMRLKIADFLNRFVNV